MVTAGLIEEVPDDARPGDAAGRARYYRVTSRGRRALAEAAEHMAALAGAARRRLGEASS